MDNNEEYLELKKLRTDTFLLKSAFIIANDALKSYETKSTQKNFFEVLKYTKKRLIYLSENFRLLLDWLIDDENCSNVEYNFQEILTPLSFILSLLKDKNPEYEITDLTLLFEILIEKTTKLHDRMNKLRLSSYSDEIVK